LLTLLRPAAPPRPQRATVRSAALRGSVTPRSALAQRAAIFFAG
jgi:hypothetical protein